jgi:hypothetical protein
MNEIVITLKENNFLEDKGNDKNYSKYHIFRCEMSLIIYP